VKNNPNARHLGSATIRPFDQAPNYVFLAEPVRRAGHGVTLAGEPFERAL